MAHAVTLDGVLLSMRSDYRFSSKALLRQPGGFEGLGVVPEVLGLADFSVPNGEDGRQPIFDSGPCPWPCQTQRMTTRTAA
jgi:hypothetical protein